MRSLLLVVACAWSISVGGQNIFFFQDSNQSGYYDSGLAFRSGSSFLEQAGPTGDKLPVEYNLPPYEGENALRLRWRSQGGGDWSALVIAPGFPFQNITNSDTLSFWAYAPQAIAASAMPLIYMEGAPGNTKSRRYSLGPYTGSLPAQQWVQVKVPLSLFFDDPNQTNINFAQIKAIIFGQDAADGAEHTLLIDEVKTYNGSQSAALAAPPANISARGYDSHVELNWQPGNEPQLAGYRIYRSLDGGQSFQPLRFLSRTHSQFIDFVRPLGANLSLQYRFTALNTADQESSASAAVSAATYDMSDEEFLEMVQEYTFRYFWDFAHPGSGLIRERNTSLNTVTIGGTGFGVMALLVGIERGFITRQQGLERLLLMTTFLENADRFRGAFPHWMNGDTGATIPFSTMDNGGDLVETAFLIQGLLAARSYFREDNADEALLREKITQIWEAVDWAWYRQNNQNLLYWHWSPNFGFAINLPLRGWNETMIVYLLGIASPTHPIPASLYHTGWAGGNYTNGFTYFGYELPLGSLLGGPLFFTHYSFLGFDPRDKRDAYANFWVQNRNQTLINRAYCINNSGGYAGYGENSWGLTASDDPLVGYLAHEPHPSRDNGTIAPTAALSSMPYTPTESMAALKHFYRNLGQRLWGPMGFYDAFNLSEDWYANSYLAIDQGPIIGMIENHRSHLLWDNFMANPEIQEALDAIGFVPDTLTVASKEQLAMDGGIAVEVFPNPAGMYSIIKLDLDYPAVLHTGLYDSNGRRVLALFQGQSFATGKHLLPLDLGHLPTGVYYLRIHNEQQALTERILLMK
jgi:hypothetical protein